MQEKDEGYMYMAGQWPSLAQYTWRLEDGKRQEAGLASPVPRAALVGEAGGRPLALDTGVVGDA